MLTFEQIKELIDLVSERQLEGLEIERSGFRLKIAGKSALPAGTAVSEAMFETPAADVQSTAGGLDLVGSETPEPAAAPGEDVPADGHVVKSPIVGTFYTSPNPDSDPYVTVGDAVKKGHVFCIVEAMKLMNEIESDVEGVIGEIYPTNAQPVEFGEPLFLIHTG